MYGNSQPLNAGTRKNKCRSKHAISYVYNDASTSDSDYDPRPKLVKDLNTGLKAPSNSRLHVQAIIHTAKEKLMAARANGKDPPIIPIDESKNKQCCYCPNTFYYSAGLKTHIKHAHRDIISVKGINNPESPPAAAVIGSNNENKSEPKPSASTGNDVPDTPVNPVLSSSPIQ